MITAEEVRAKLDGYPEAVLTDYARFAADRDVAALHRFILGLIHFLHDSDGRSSIDDLADTADLRADLGIDSITIAEVVFLIEDIFEIEIANAELISINTIGELKAFITGKVA
jgi:3-hydroxyacyl-[acyl-carrier-protein] dehydratase